LRRVPGLHARPHRRGGAVRRAGLVLHGPARRHGREPVAGAREPPARALSGHVPRHRHDGGPRAGRVVHGFVHAGAGRRARARVQSRLVRAARAARAAHRRGLLRSGPGHPGRADRARVLLLRHRVPADGARLEKHPLAGFGICGGLAVMGSKVRVAIIGVGNCASSFVQGLHYYRNARATDRVPGLMHVNLGGYHVSDVEIAAAIDVDANKVGRDVAEAIVTWPNNTAVFAKVPPLGVSVQRGMTHDGLGKYLSQIIQKAPGSTVDVVQLLKDTRTDVVVNYLPVGSEEATKWYVEQVLEAGCAFVNCIPVFIASQPYWQNRFKARGLPLIGDDIKSQVGATITHRLLANLFRERGVRLDRTYQLNFGCNTDFMNMLERERLESKKISKTNAVTSQLDHKLTNEQAHVGPGDYVPWLEDRKFCYIRMEGTTFGNVPLSCEL